MIKIGDVTLSCDKIGILCVNLNNINLDDNNYDEYDLDNILHVKLLTY